jgi:hypothetical protein
MKSTRPPLYHYPSWNMASFKLFNKGLHWEWTPDTVRTASLFTIGSNELFCNEFVKLSKALRCKVFLMTARTKRTNCYCWVAEHCNDMRGSQNLRFLYSFVKDCLIDFDVHLFHIYFYCCYGNRTMGIISYSQNFFFFVFSYEHLSFDKTFTKNVILAGVIHMWRTNTDFCRRVGY